MSESDSAEEGLLASRCGACEVEQRAGFSAACACERVCVCVCACERVSVCVCVCGVCA